MPALIILIVLFMFHQQGKRQESRTQAVAAEAEAKQSEARAAELEQLVVFGEALGRSLDLDAIHDVVVQQHGGQLDVESEPGLFTELVIKLPKRATGEAQRGAEGRGEEAS